MFQKQAYKSFTVSLIIFNEWASLWIEPFRCSAGFGSSGVCTGSVFFFFSFCFPVFCVKPYMYSQNRAGGDGMFVFKVT